MSPEERDEIAPRAEGGSPPQPVPTDNGEADRPAPEPRTSEEVQEMLISYLAEELEIGADDIDPEAPLDTLSLDSVTAVGMIGDLEEQVGCRIDPMAVYDYPTLASLSEFVAQKTQGTDDTP